MTHKEITARIRSDIRSAGIAARCRMIEACGVCYVQVNASTFESRFTEAEQRTIRAIAKANGLTGARGAAIDVERMTNPASFDFEVRVRPND